MNRVEKYHRQKELNTPPEIRLHKKRVDKLLMLLFGEEWDFMFDSSVDCKRRASGQNPMDAEYTARINAKRESFGISPLGENGMPQDESSKEFCERIIMELEQIK